MKLGFVGIGQVGGTLAKVLAKHGHDIALGTRKIKEKGPQELAEQIGSSSQILSVPETIKCSDVLFLATPWNAVDPFLKEHAPDLEDKILIDCTNPLKPDLSGLILSGESSGGEHIRQLAPHARVVKAFNTVGFNIMAQPTLDGRKAMMYFCGDDSEARDIVRQLIEEVGFLPIEAGGISTSRLLEPLAMLWIKSAYGFGLGREFAFSLIKNK